MLEVGDKIKSYRSSKGWTQGVFAEKLDVSVGYISEIETGRRVPSLATLLSIAELLECTPDKLLGYEGKKGKKTARIGEGADETVEATMQMMYEMGPEERYKVFTYAKDQRRLFKYLQKLRERRGEMSSEEDFFTFRENPESLEK